MKKNLVLIFSIVFIILVLIGISFLFMKSNKKEDNLQSKTIEEIDYLENKIVSMMNNLNNISFTNSVLKQEKEKVSKSENSEGGSTASGSSGESKGSSSGSGSSDGAGGEGGGSQESSGNEETSKDELKYTVERSSVLLSTSDKVDWEYMKSNIETIHSLWSTIIIDLHDMNVANQDILNFSSSLDKVTLSIKQEDKTASLNNLANLYAYVPTYLEQFSNNSKKTNLAYTKACVLNTYAFAEQDKWDEMKTQSTNAISYFYNIMNNVEGNKQDENKISKIYVSLNELNNTIDLKDKDLYYIKYKNVMEELMKF